MNTLGEIHGPAQDIQWQTYQAFFTAIQLLLKHRVTLVAEAAFQHDLWVPELERLRQIACIRIVICSIDPQLARARHIARGLADPGREHFHDDRALKAAREGRQLPLESYDPPNLQVPILNVDTTEGYKPAFESIFIHYGTVGPLAAPPQLLDRAVVTPPHRLRSRQKSAGS